MKKILTISLIIFAFAFVAFGQKLVKPTLKPVLPTAAQLQTIREGVALHDAKKYDEAIAKYQSVLDESPECTAAMYELSFSLDAKGEREKSMEVATKGAKYISDELPLFYVAIANTLDDLGQPKEAVKIYQTGIKLLEGDIRFGAYRSSLYFNLGVTYLKLKKNDDARSAFKSSVESNYSYASPNFWLSLVYNSSQYKIPSFLAASRFISLEYKTERTNKAAAVIADVLKPAPKDPKTGNINIFVSMDAPKDEGDFGMYELFLGTLTTVKGDNDKDKTENEMFVDAIGTLIALVAENKKLASTFVGKNYIPFMVELKKKGYVEPLGYLVLYNTGNNLAYKWLQTNGEKLDEFVKWAKAYQPPSK